MKLEDELGREMTPKAKIVHLALCVLGPGTYLPGDICDVIGYNHPRGRGVILNGAKELKSLRLCTKADRAGIVAGPAYAKKAPAKKKGASNAA